MVSSVLGIYQVFLERPAEEDWKEFAGVVFGEGYGVGVGYVYGPDEVVA